MWQKNRAPGIHWGDSRIEVLRESNGLRERWNEEVLHSTRFEWVRDPELRLRVCRESTNSSSALRPFRRGKKGKNDDGFPGEHHFTTIKVVSITVLAICFIGGLLLLIASCFESQIVADFLSRSGSYTTLQ